MTLSTAHNSQGRRYCPGINTFSDNSTIATDRLLLTPLRVVDAEEMVEVLANPELYEFTRGEPPSLDNLRDRYQSWVGGSGRDSERWLNWIVRRRDDHAAIGTAQATVIDPDHEPVAVVAWTIGVGWQRRGYATEAANALVEWLVDHGVDSIAAHIHREHTASANVATRAGLRPTSELVDGEVVWRLPRLNDQSV